MISCLNKAAEEVLMDEMMIKKMDNERVKMFLLFSILKVCIIFKHVIFIIQKNRNYLVFSLFAIIDIGWEKIIKIILIWGLYTIGTWNSIIF